MISNYFPVNDLEARAERGLAARLGGWDGNGGYPGYSAGSCVRGPRWRRFLTPWRSPADQPAWARPALLAVAAVVAVAYGWGMAGASVESFYGAAARSMSQDWHDFIFGAFDPAGTVTVDKLPGAPWVQALSLKVFGLHIWALVLPQVVEGVLTVLVLYRTVRRLAGPAAGLTAAAVLAVTPITVLLSRGNVVLAAFFSAGTYINSYYVAALVPALAALCGTGVAACGPGPWPARVRLIAAATVLGCAGYGACLMSGTQSGPVVLTVVAAVVALGAAAQLALRSSGTGRHLTPVVFAGAAVLLLPAAASVSGVIGGLGPFDTPFESSKTAHHNQLLAADAPRITRAVQELELRTPPGDALFGTDTSGLAQNYILYGGVEVLPIGGYLGNVPVPTLAALESDISRGYVRLFVLPVSPPGPDPQVRWIESHCTMQPPPPDRRPVPYANFICGPGTARQQAAPASQG